MSIRKKIYRGGVSVGISQAVTQICSFLRNIIIARIISPSDFGLAAMFSITLSLLEMISNLAADKLIIQSQEGDQEDFQATIQFVQFLRGCSVGIILFLISGPVAGLFGVPHATWAFRWLAFIPIVRGLVNQDINRLQRELKFGPAIFAGIVSNVIVTLIAYPLGIFFHDYSAMLWIIVLQSALFTLATHIVSIRRYAFAFHKKYVGELFSFGWPLLINGLLMFGIMQGDRFIIGSANKIFGKDIYSLEQLGVYSVVFSLTFAPTMLIANISTSLLFPLLSSLQKEADRFNRNYKLANQVISIAGGIITIPMIISGEWLVTTIYGSKYTSGVGVIGWLAAMQAMRIFRVGPTLAAMSKGDTRNAMYSNIVRTVALLGGFLSAYLNADISWIAFSGFVGELMAFSVCIARLKLKHGISPFSCLNPVAISLLFMAISIVIMFIVQIDPRSIASLIVSTTTVVLYVGTFLVMFGGLRKEIHSIIAT